MKYILSSEIYIATLVALFTRAWIEIVYVSVLVKNVSYVALFTRAWIEIDSKRYPDCNRSVALFTRAWIEIRSI